MTRRFSIHFHVWTPRAYMEMLTYCKDAGLPLELELIQRNEHEFLTVLRKTDIAASDQSQRLIDRALALPT